MRLLAIAGLLGTVLGDGAVFNFANIGRSVDITTREATLNLANTFGLNSKYVIDSTVDLEHVVLDDHSIVVVVSDVEEPKDFFSKYGITPEYNFPVGNSVTQLLKKVPKDENNFKLSNKFFVSNSMAYLKKVWKEKVQGVESDLAQLAYFLENKDINDSKVIAFMPPSDALVKLLAENGKATVVVLPEDKTKRDHIAPSSNSVFTSSTPGCYANQLACIEETDSCSGHGICTLAGSCYRCLCSSTEENDRTTHWTGVACEKVDYSAPFHLIFWTCLITILLGVSGIKLLASCGSEELPGVLQAATMQTKKNV